MFNSIFIKAKTDFFNKFLGKTALFYFSDDALFNKIVRNGVKNTDFINTEILLGSVLKYIESCENTSVESTEKPIKLYLIYGIDYLIDDEKTFQITIAHQKVDTKTKELYEYRVELHYLPDEFSDIEDYNIRLEDETKINVFADKIRKSKGFIRSLKNKPMRILIESEII
jgi:hypothetical protein